MILNNFNTNMEKQTLLYKITGTEEPKFVSEREMCIIDKCLKVINNIETDFQQQNQILNLKIKSFENLINNPELKEIIDKIGKGIENSIYTGKKKYRHIIKFEEIENEMKNKHKPFKLHNGFVVSCFNSLSEMFEFTTDLGKYVLYQGDVLDINEETAKQCVEQFIQRCKFKNYNPETFKPDNIKMNGFNYATIAVQSACDKRYCVIYKD